ncbi:non-ribosomal peptide synthetase [Longispora albida]|uniref:non-ribosomal peptide synthetase n=1 Tax=Longispora albida TaxID=203523 RepID=UPI00036E56F0|nr:non-ribosomal peptide synthetase [Longispora albida]
MTGTAVLPRGEGLHETMSRLARQHPEAIVLAAGDRRVSYAELDRLSDGWAALLASAGAGRGDLVPILLPRGVDLVVALLAVLKAGGAYALLDPAWPPTRISGVTSQLGAPLMIAPAGTTGVDLPVWSPPAGPVEVPDDFEAASVTGDDPCCVFFTSGTTGQPKGALIPHRAPARMYRPGTFAEFGPGNVMALYSAVPWDGFSFELWSALLTGGTAVLLDEPYLSPDALRACTARQGVTMAWLTSSLFNLVVEEDIGAFTGLRQVMTGGERVSPGHMERFLQAHPGIALINGYGPVENTMLTTAHRVTPADTGRPGGIPIGRLIPGTRVYILDGDQECSAGETGEICVAGEGLALGYVGDPELTARKFPVVELGGEPVRVYRTGDLGTWAADGLLEFCGRADRQLKLRGHRIEPAEVERQIEQLEPRVKSCRVIARRDAAGVPEALLAFCVPASEGDELADVLPALASALVPYHRPAALVGVPAFPLTAYGKLDERALLASVDRPPVAADVELPADSTARAVAEVFGDVLGLPGVPLDATFTELGGTSLGAARVCARLADRLGRPVPLSRMYQHSTVDALSGWLRATAGTEAEARAAAGADGTALTPMQLVYLTRSLTDPKDLTSHCFMCWEVEGELDTVALESAVAWVHHRQEALRAAYVSDPRPAALPSGLGPPPLEHLPGEESVRAAAGALLAELADPLDLAGGEVWRVALAAVEGTQVSVLGIVVHHIAFDGWSGHVLAEELSAGYRAAVRGEPGTTRLPASLAEVAADRAAYLAHSDPAVQHEAVRARLRDVPVLRWPQGTVAPGAPVHLEHVLGPEVLSAVDDRAARAGVTRFTVLLSAWAASLCEVTGNAEISAGIPVSQRASSRLEEVVGCHITMVCARLTGASIAETSRAAEEAFAAQDVPFSTVLDLLDLPRTGRPPLFQTLFALQDTPQPRLVLDGARSTLLRQPYPDLPLELHTELWPEPDGTTQVMIAYRPGVVPEAVARAFASSYLKRLTGMVAQ